MVPLIFLTSLELHPKTGKQALEILDVFAGSENKLYEHEDKTGSNIGRVLTFPAITCVPAGLIVSVRITTVCSCICP